MKCLLQLFMENVKCVFFLTAEGAIQEEVVYFGLGKQEVVLFQRPVGEDKTSSPFNPILNTAVMICQCLSSTYCVSLLCVNVGCGGVRGHIHWYREQWLLCEGVYPNACSGKQVEVWCYGGDAGATICLHVWGGEGAERVAGCPQTGPSQAHGTAGLYQ